MGYMRKVTRSDNKDHKIKIKSLSGSKNSQIRSLFQKILAEAKIDPKYQQLVSSVLSREVNSEKSDTRQYNTKFISYSDSQAINLMDAGIRGDFYSGDSVLFQSKILSKKGINWLVDSIKSALEKKDYISFPFCPEISSDLRTKYLLRTEDTDTNESILAELRVLLGRFMDEEELQVLFSCIKKAEVRFKNTPVKFVAPIDDVFLGKSMSYLKKKKRNMALMKKSRFVLMKEKMTMI